MGFEVFDDVAFYFLMQSGLAMALIPYTIFKLTKLCGKGEKKESSVTAKAYEAEVELEVSQNFAQKHFTLKNVVLGFLWLIFLYNCTQLGEYINKELKSYDPVDILGVSPDADDDTIKKAYKKLSLMWHPDKNPDNLEEAEAKFIEVSKAYKALIDPKAKANMKKFGNVDGYQGTSMTIGLPSFLLEKENSLKVLLVYFLIMILTPPICVFVWWKRASSVTESGIGRNTMQDFFYLISEHMSPKYLIAVLTFANEFRVIGSRDNSGAAEEERKKLKCQVQEHMVAIHSGKVLRYVHAERGHVLLLAYLHRLPIPKILQPDLTLILQESHKLLNGMMSVCLSKKMVKATIGCVDLMQMISQAMWPGFSPLLQLPHMNPKEIKYAFKKKMDTLDSFRVAPAEKREKCYEKTPEQWRTINKVMARLPDVAMDCQAFVEDEQGIYEHDFVTIKVTLERIKPDVERKVKEVTEVTDEDAEPAAEEDELPQLTDDKDEPEVEIDQGALDLAEWARLAEMPVSKPQANKLTKLLENEIPVHSAFFPFEKSEKWVVMLFQKTPNKTLHLMAVNKVPAFLVKEVVQIQMRVGEKGVSAYEVHAKCDSYVGCDVSLNFKITVNKMTEKESNRRENRLQHSRDYGLDDSDHEEEDGQDGQDGQPFAFSNTAEMIGNIVVLGLVGMFAMNFLQSRGYWQQYVDPVINELWAVLAPIWASIEPVISPLKPVWDVVAYAWNWFGDMMAVDPEELVAARSKTLEF